MKIGFLYFDECPNHQEALRTLKDLIDENRIEAQLELSNIISDEEAASNLFLGSPTIRVNGVDIDLHAQGRTDFGRKCRIYLVDNEVLGSPSKEMILGAIRGANQVAVSVKLLVAKWCPICPSAKQLWRELKEQFRFEYEEVDINSPEGKELVARHSVLSVPTTIIGGKVAFSGKVERSKAVEVLAHQCPWCFTQQVA